MKRLVCLSLMAVILVGCPPVPPNPPPSPPDATDALAPPVIDAAPPPPAADAAPTPTVVDAALDAASPTCVSACANMSTLRCSGVTTACASSLAYIEAHRLIVNDAGVPATCKCIAKAASKAAVESCGIGCK